MLPTIASSALSGAEDRGVESGNAPNGLVEIPTSPPAHAGHTIANVPPPSETPTVTATGKTPDFWEGEDEDIQIQPDVPIVSSGESRPLRERVPSVKAVLSQVQLSHQIQQLFENSPYFYWKGKFWDKIFGSALWEEMHDTLTEAVVLFTPNSEDEVKRNSRRFERKKRRIIEDLVGNYKILDLNPNDSLKEIHVQAIQMLLGEVFLVWFQRLITPPRGQVRISVEDQIQNIVGAVVEKDVNELFDPKVAQHVYYIVGFLCNTGVKDSV